MAISPIILAQAAAPGATPITYNATSSQTFAANFYKLAQGNISEQDRKAISALGLIYELTAAGGANYKANHAGLVQDAQVYSGAIPNIDLATAMAALEWNAGNVADATLSTNVNTLLQEARDLSVRSKMNLDRIIIFLRAQLRR